MRSKPWLQKWSFLLYISFWFQQTAFTSKKDYGKEDRAAQWVVSQRSLQGYTSGDLETNGRRSSLIAEQARRRAEIARYYKLLFQCSLFTMTCFMIFYMDLIQSKLPGLQIFYPPDALAYSVDMWYIYIYIYIALSRIFWHGVSIEMYFVIITLEFCRLGELHTLRGHVESVVRLKNLDLNVIQSAHTVWCNDINSFIPQISSKGKAGSSCSHDSCWVYFEKENNIFHLRVGGNGIGDLCSVLSSLGSKGQERISKGVFN